LHNPRTGSEGFFFASFVNTKKNVADEGARTLVGEIIHIDSLRIKREEKLREYALDTFPWTEMERVKVKLIEPMTKYWPPSRKWLLMELCYRLVYEAFVCGLKEAKAQGKAPMMCKAESHHFTSRHHAACQTLVEQLTKEFHVFQWLDEWSAESVFILLGELSKNWFMKGYAGKR
jgi:hypothetical protein